MTIHVDFPFARYEDGLLTVSMAPPTAVGGSSLRFSVTKRFGASLSGVELVKSCASGYGDGVSGVTVLNSGTGIFRISLSEADTSGMAPGCHAAAVERLDSGNRKTLCEGYLILAPNVRG